MVREYDSLLSGYDPKTGLTSDASTVSPSSLTPYNVLARIAVPALSGVTRNALETQTRADHTLIISALNNSRTAQGTWPETLPPESPRDRATGAPVQYERADDGSITLTSGATRQGPAIVTTVR